MKMISKTALILVSVVLLASCAHYRMRTEKHTIAQLAAANSNLSTLVVALQKAHLVDTLNGAGPYTVFAPTNRAFNKLPPGKLQALLAQPAQLRQVLLYHVVSGKITSGMIHPGHVKTVQGQSVAVRISHGRVYINNAKVTTADVMASNGVIHIVNAVLIPHL